MKKLKVELELPDDVYLDLKGETEVFMEDHGGSFDVFVSLIIAAVFHGNVSPSEISMFDAVMGEWNDWNALHK